MLLEYIWSEWVTVLFRRLRLFMATTTFVMLLILYRNAFQTFTTESISFLRNSGSGHGKSLTNLVLQGALAPIRAAFNVVTGAFVGTINDVLRVLFDAIETVVGALRVVVNQITGAATDAINSVKQTAEDVINAGKEALNAIKDQIMDILLQIENAAKLVSDTVTGLPGMIATHLENFGKDIKGLAEDELKGFATNAAGEALKVGTSALNGAADISAKAGKGIRDIGIKTTEGLQKVGEAVTIATDKIDELGDKAVAEVGAAVTAEFNKIEQRLRSAFKV